MFAWIRDIGSLLGLITAVFYFYDRLAKGRPIPSLTISESDVRPPTYFLAPDMELKSIVRGAAGRKHLFMLKPNEGKELVIAPIIKDGLALEVNSHNVCFEFRWRRGDATW